MNIAVILSGGTGSRMGSNLPKQYQLLRNKPIIIYTLEQFQRHADISCIIVVAACEWTAQISQWKEIFHLTKIAAITPCGLDRQMSIRNGLLAAEPFLMDERDEKSGVIIQDAVRPLTSVNIITRLIEGLHEAPCVMPVLAATDTAYISKDGHWIDGLLDRSTLYGGQAPEAFCYWPYLRLYMDTPLSELSAMSGSCQLPYRAGWKVKIVPGERENIKITYPLDLKICEMLLREKEGIT